MGNEIYAKERGHNMERILTILRVLDHSKNAIFLISTETVTANGGNDKARKLFGLTGRPVELEHILGPEFSSDGFMEKVIPSLMEKEKCLIVDAPVVSQHGEPIPCDLEFVLASDDMEFIFLIIRIKEDRRPQYLDMLLKKSKRPTFILDYSQDLKVRDGNDLFFHSFACTRENIEQKYNSLFENFLVEETRVDDVERILAAIPEEPSGVIDIHIQTAHGDTLHFYYNSQKLTPLLEEHEKCLFCKLVEPEESLPAIEYPYEKPYTPPK